MYDSDEELDREADSMFCGWFSKRNHKLGTKNGLNNSKCDFLPQLAQNVVIGVLPFGDRIRGAIHPGVGQDRSVRTWQKVMSIRQHQVAHPYPAFQQVIPQNIGNIRYRRHFQSVVQLRTTKGRKFYCA